MTTTFTKHSQGIPMIEGYQGYISYIDLAELLGISQLEMTQKCSSNEIPNLKNIERGLPLYYIKLSDARALMLTMYTSK